MSTASFLCDHLRRDRETYTRLAVALGDKVSIVAPAKKNVALGALFWYSESITRYHRASPLILVLCFAASSPRYCCCILCR